MTNDDIMKVARGKMLEVAKRAGVDATYVLAKVKETVERCSQAVPVLGPFGKARCFVAWRLKFTYFSVHSPQRPVGSIHGQVANTGGSLVMFTSKGVGGYLKQKPYLSPPVGGSKCLQVSQISDIPISFSVTDQSTLQCVVEYTTVTC